MRKLLYQETDDFLTFTEKTENLCMKILTEKTRNHSNEQRVKLNEELLLGLFGFLFN